MIPLFFGLVFGSALFGGGTISRFERDAAADLRDKLQGDQRLVLVHAHLGLGVLVGRLASVSIKASEFSCDRLPLYCEPSRSRYGRLEHIRFSLSHFSLHGVPVESMSADIVGSRFDLAYALAHHKLRVSRSGAGPLRMVFNLSDIKQFALRKFPQAKGLSVTVVQGRLVMETNVALAGLALSIHLTGIPAIRSGTQLVLSEPQLTVNGKALDAGETESFLKPLTPLLDLDRDLDAHGGIQLARISVEGATLVGSGTAKIPEQPKALGS